MSERSYADMLRERDEYQRSLPRREYISNEEYRKLKAALTRAKNSGDPEKVLRTVEAAVEVFNAKVWPDAWAMWRIALEDAALEAEMAARGAQRKGDWGESDRLETWARECRAASIILFN